ncbi:MAG: hypothetical protein AAF467_27730 [Actinomycetota bacterium]
MSIDINDIAGPDGDSFKFTDRGDKVAGTIIHVDETVRENQFNGNNEKVLRITLDTDDGTKIIWPVTNTNVDGDGYASRMAKAIVAAIRAANATTLEVGARLGVEYYDDQDTDKGNPAKLYRAQYKPPTTTAADSGDEAAVVADDLV